MVAGFQRVSKMFTLIEALLFRLGPILLSRKCNLFIGLSLFSLVTQSLGIGDVIWAVNCGGEGHTDIHGIRYEADPLKIGIASDYGKTLMISRVVPQDNILYQTERYHMSTFGYEVPIKEDGDYVLVLKFCEVWFTSPNQKVSALFIHCSEISVILFKMLYLLTWSASVCYLNPKIGASKNIVKTASLCHHL